MREVHRLPRVKICGLSTVADARAALSAGADAIGLVHHAPSPRSIEAAAAAEIVATLPAEVLPVAVLVDARPHDALAWARRAGARALQLCGAERADEWSDFPLPLLRRVSVDAAGRAEFARWSRTASGFVLDHPSGPGGSGREVDFDLAARLARIAPCLLAGGLDEDNVAEAIRAVQPAGVDASSRLELEPGRKDHARVREFVARATAAMEQVHG